MFVSEDKGEALVFCFQVMAVPNPPRRTLRLDGLDPELEYEVQSGHRGEKSIIGGDRLMKLGLPLAYEQKDYESKWFRLQAIKPGKS